MISSQPASRSLPKVSIGKQSNPCGGNLARPMSSRTGLLSFGEAAQQFGADLPNRHQSTRLVGAAGLSCVPLWPRWKIATRHFSSRTLMRCAKYCFSAGLRLLRVKDWIDGRRGT